MRELDFKQRILPFHAQSESVYSGVGQDRDGNPVPGLMGRLCRWSSSRPAATFASYEDFHDSLNLDCPEKGRPGTVRFTPNANMPDTIYYQVSMKIMYFCAY